MIPFALLAIILAGIAVTLVARAGALPRVQAAQRLDQIAAYGTGDRAAADEHRSDHALFEGLANRIGSLVARVAGAKTDGLRSELMAAGVYRISPTALLGYRALATVGLPALGLVLAPAA